MDDLITIKELVAENPDDLTLHQYYRGVRNGALPVIQVGPSRGYRMTRELWRKYKCGEHIDDRYFLKTTTSDVKPALKTA